MRFVAITFALVLCACQGATVISDTGTRTIGYCSSASWVKCVHDLCPNGYVLVQEPSSKLDDGIIACNKPQ